MGPCELHDRLVGNDLLGQDLPLLILSLSQLGLVDGLEVIPLLVLVHSLYLLVFEVDDVVLLSLRHLLII
jgi:hypothetical protein